MAAPKQVHPGRYAVALTTALAALLVTSPSAFAAGTDWEDTATVGRPTTTSEVAWLRLKTREVQLTTQGRLSTGETAELARAHAAIEGRTGSAVPAGAGRIATTYPPAANLGHYSFFSQEDPWWCGPAAAMMALQDAGERVASNGSVLTQRILAHRLDTGRYYSLPAYPTGTDPKGGTGWAENILAPTLTNWVSGGFTYVQSPTLRSSALLEGRVKSTVYRYHRSVIGEVAGPTGFRYRLLNHPSDRPIYHWFSIYGYRSNGDEIYYADSVSGAGLTWGGSVRPFNLIGSSRLVLAMDDRGVVW